MRGGQGALWAKLPHEEPKKEKSKQASICMKGMKGLWKTKMQLSFEEFIVSQGRKFSWFPCFPLCDVSSGTVPAPCSLWVQPDHVARVRDLDLERPHNTRALARALRSRAGLGSPFAARAERELACSECANSTGRHCYCCNVKTVRTRWCSTPRLL